MEFKISKYNNAMAVGDCNTVSMLFILARVGRRQTSLAKQPQLVKQHQLIVEGILKEDELVRRVTTS